jgi:hypothetical protein
VCDVVKQVGKHHDLKDVDSVVTEKPTHDHVQIERSRLQHRHVRLFVSELAAGEKVYLILTVALFLKDGGKIAHRFH